MDPDARPSTFAFKLPPLSIGMPGQAHFVQGAWHAYNKIASLIPGRRGRGSDRRVGGQSRAGRRAGGGAPGVARGHRDADDPPRSRWMLRALGAEIVLTGDTFRRGERRGLAPPIGARLA